MSHSAPPARLTPPMLSGRSRPLVVLLAVLVAATILGLIDASQVQYDRAVRGEPISWGHALIHGLPRWYGWALLAPVIVFFARRIDRVETGRLGKLLLHAPAGILVTLLQVGWFSGVSTILHERPDRIAALRPAFLKYIGLTFLGGLATYAAIVGGWYAIQIYRAYRDREREAARLELQTAELHTLLAEARLRRLQAQLEPHFLFNSLHAVTALMLEGDTTGAVRMTTRLSHLLRSALRAGERLEHSLEEELELVDDYLAIQRLRFEDRLEATREIGPGLGDARVPSLILQPLIENAIRHGIEADPRAREVAVRVEREDDILKIVVRNDGPPLADPARTDAGVPGSGVGLANTRERLSRMYGEAASLRVADAAEGGVEVVVSLPYRSSGRTDEGWRSPEPAESAGGAA